MITFLPLVEVEAPGLLSHCFVQELDNHLANDERFNEFINQHSPSKKWLLVSDYSIGDKKKPNDCICFSLFPHVSDINELLDNLSELAPKDIKSIRVVNSRFISLLNRHPIFSIGIILEKKRRFSLDEREYFLDRTRALLKQLEIWDESTPEGSGYNAQYRSKLLRLRTKLETKSVNLKLLRDTEIISTVAGYLASMVSNHPNELVTWFSDRDSILSHMTNTDEIPLAFDFALTLHHTICSSKNQDPQGIMAFGVPEPTGKMWYDPLIRIPDFICGTLADYNLKTNEITHGKFVPVVQNILTNVQNNIFYKLSIRADGCDLIETQFKRSQC